MTTLERGGLRRSGAERRELTKFEMGIGLIVGIVGATVGTVLFLIVLTIVIGLAGGH